MPATLPCPARRGPRDRPGGWPAARSWLAALAARLTARDRWLLRMLHEHRVLTTTQITQLAFGTTRAATARLLTLYQLPRHRPVPAPGPRRVRAAALRPRRGRRRTSSPPRTASPPPSSATAATAPWPSPCPPSSPTPPAPTAFFTALAAAARASAGHAALTCWWSERRCAASWGDLARPDGYGRWPSSTPGRAAVTADFFLEYDTGTENLPRLVAKLTGYRDLAARTGITTPVLFWLPTARREAALRARLASPPPHGTPGAASAAAIPGVPVATATPGTAAGGRAGRGGLAARRQARAAAAAGPARRRPARPPPAPARRIRRPAAAARPACPGIPPAPSRPPGTPCPGTPAALPEASDD